MKIRVQFADESTEDYPANHVEIAGDGSLLLAFKAQRNTGIVDPQGRKQMEITTRLVRIIRRDLWAEVEMIDADEPTVIEINAPALARAN